MKKSLLLLLYLCISVFTYAQKEWSNWYFRGNLQMSFANGAPQLQDNFIPVDTPRTNAFNYAQLSSTGISYSDPLTGQFRFLLCGPWGFGSDYYMFPQSWQQGLYVCTNGAQGYHIIPFPNNPDKFYIVQLESYVGDLAHQETGLQTRCYNSRGLHYSIVDMSLNNGNGDFTLMNQPLINQLCEPFTNIRHANGKDVWVIVHPYNTSSYVAYLFTDNGVQPPVYSNTGPMVNGGSLSAGGYIVANHTGNLLAASGGVYRNAFALFNFDNSTGLLSNERVTHSAGDYVEDMQFSPDDSKLYCLGNNGIWQYDFNQADLGSSATMVYEFNPYSVIYDMRLGPDGKLYIAAPHIKEGDEYKRYIAAIECPNLPQYACHLNEKALYHSSETYGEFPDLINDFIKDPKASPITKFSLGDDVAVCFANNNNLTLTAPDGWESYQWNTGETGRQIKVTKPGLYYVLTGVTGFSCPEGYGYINITDKAEKLNLGSDTILCPKTSYLLSVPVNYTNIIWENGSGVRDSVITKAGNYIITANDRNGCFTKDTIGVYYKYYPSADFGTDATLCNQSALTLQLQPVDNIFQSYHANYTWQDGSKEASYTVNKSGIYWGTVTYDGCTISDTIQVNYITAEGISLGNDTTLCSGDVIQLKPAAAGTAYTWNTGETTSAISVNEAGSYWVKVNNGNCTQADTIQVVYHNKPQFSLGEDKDVCKGSEPVLQSPTEGNLTWQDGSANVYDSVKASGWYWLEAKADGCAGRDSVYITVNPPPDVQLPDDTGFCEGASVLLHASAATAASYLWQDGSTKPDYLALKAGAYWVQATSGKGCSRSDAVQVAVVTPPAFSLGNDTVLCESEKIDYHFSFADASYQWSDGNSHSDYHISASGHYSLTITQQGCAGTDDIAVTTQPKPVTALGNDTALCEGQALWIGDETAGTTYKWQDGSTQALYHVFSAGNYQVTADLNGCKASDDITISYKLKPKFTLGVDQVLCKGEAVELAPPIAGMNTYLWEDGSILPKQTVRHEGTYRLEVTNECGTTADDIQFTEAVCVLQMPTAFTPNKDGVNDLFRVKYPGYIKDFRMAIFTRWGQLIANITDPYKGWDGSCKSVPLDAGTYIWKIQLTDKEGIVENKNGTVVLIR